MSILVYLTSFWIATASAQAPSCIGRGDPKKTFYIDKLAIREQRAAEIPQELHHFERELENATNRRAQIHERDIPQLQSEKSNLETRAAESKENLKNRLLAEAKRSDDNIQSFRAKEKDQANRNLIRFKEKQANQFSEWKANLIKAAKKDGNFSVNPQLMGERLNQEIAKKESELRTNEKNYRRELATKIQRALKALEQGKNLRLDDINKDALVGINQIEARLSAIDENLKSLEKESEDLDKKIQSYIENISGLNNEANDIAMIRAWSSEKSKSTEGDACINCSQQEKDEAKVRSFLNGIKEIFTPSSSKTIPKLNIACVLKSLDKKAADTPEITCDSVESTPKTTRHLCVDESVADYVHWNINKALACLSDPKDPIDPNIIFMKINNESTFRPFYSYSGGRGLMQITTCAKDEMFGMSPSRACGLDGPPRYRSSGRDFLARKMASNPEKCAIYKNIFNYEAEVNYMETKDKKGYPQATTRLFDNTSANTCEDASLGEGIQRNLINGLGLYLYYRDGGSGSAGSLLERDLGLNKSNHSDFRRMRDYLALFMYGPDGQNDATKRYKKLLPTIKAALKKGKLNFDEFKKILMSSPGKRNYLKETESSLKTTMGDVEGELPCAVR